MAREDMLKMSVKELPRVHIVQQVLEKKLKEVEAARLLGLTDRQIRRILKRVDKEGARGIIHRSRGKPSNRCIDQKIKKRVLKLYTSKYSDFGPTLATEKLGEIDGVYISTETLRGWLMQAGYWQRKRRRRTYRRWRQRKAHCGEMLQIDGSHHDWLEGRGPECVLMGYIDDATNRVFGGFYEYEGSIPALDSFKGYIQRYGIPLSVYLDKHSTYKSTAKPSIEEQLNDRKPMSQFQRALSELGVQVIHAHSPQAKGRIERLFGVFQDRLIKEMRIAQIKTLPQANGFLEKYLRIYNKRFSVQPAQAADLHRPPPCSKDLDQILCVKNHRTVRNDSTIAYKGKLYQIQQTTGRKKLIVQDRLDGSMWIMDGDKSLAYQEITSRPIKARETAAKAFTLKKAYKPSMSHPWKRMGYYFQKEKTEQTKRLYATDSTA
jgi:hypothetical protein